MAWIQIVEEPEAKGELAEYYKKAREQGRNVSNVQKIMSLNPSAMKAIDELQRSWRENASLQPRHQEMVALTTSALNRCEY